ncbi:N-formylglutamate amidohydrolase [Sphingomonas tabacisoli]|uniref:N-formylglutamate amidohydrolase n=1 Tax=Sphingomonas tabacisoli TaxID=2249466 RepID=A0ABW4I2U3_9SPHN
MTEAYHFLPGTPDSGILVVVDHASRDVPDDIDLGIDPALIDRHIGWDIGAADLGQALCRRFGCPGLFGDVSRLVLDLHREEDSAALIPESSDGHAIPGNHALTDSERRGRIERFWRPYHGKLAELVAETRPALIAAVHSFTPRLETSVGPDRPWQVGILYNQDDRAARLAIAELRAVGIETGDNEPYSGKLLNATMNMHAEANGIPYLAIEVRNDLIRETAEIEHWVDTLERVIVHCRNKLAPERSFRT